ncbi:hypothetical protein CK203_094679 [Vitis vinifera]|uniref:Uncharacterized protein n=1 Tax=Vitis vinifera TaxID=29760 RepID=A0A438BX09_VITVI|nr:hypothetical protein CK203_094679 [Vitis vinifera]
MAAYFLNPRFQYRPRVGNNLDLLQAFHEVYAKLHPIAVDLNQFENEVREPVMEMIMEVMERILDNNTKVNIHRAHSFVKIISCIVHKMNTMTPEELVQVLEPLESCIGENIEG